MSAFIVDPRLSQKNLWCEIDFTRGSISRALRWVMYADGETGDAVRQAFGTLHMVKRSFDQLQDLI